MSHARQVEPFWPDPRGPAAGNWATIAAINSRPSRGANREGLTGRRGWGPVSETDGLGGSRERSHPHAQSVQFEDFRGPAGTLTGDRFDVPVVGHRTRFKTAPVSFWESWRRSSSSGSANVMTA